MSSAVRAHGEDPFLALIRPAGSHEDAAIRPYTAMHECSVSIYRQALAHPPSQARIELAVQLIGVTFSRYIIKAASLARMPLQQLEHYLAPALRATLLS